MTVKGQFGDIQKRKKKFAQLSDKLLVIDKNKESIGNTFILGEILDLEGVWKKLKLDETLERVKKQYEIEFPSKKAVKLMVLNRFSDPKSKLSINRWKEKLYGEDYNDVDLQHLYRTLDILAENKDMLQQELFEKTKSLFQPVINVVFYDLTTIYFESQQEDVLRKFGYSKENKSDCVQVVMGLILSEDNIPLGYEIFSGNTFEGNTVSVMIKKLKEKFSIEKVIFVADKGILREKVLKEIEQCGCEYIVAYKLKQLPKNYHNQILQKENYKKISEDLWLTESKIKERRVILGYSYSKAERDKAMRKVLLEKLQSKIKKGQGKTLIKSAYKKYLNVGEMKIEIEQSKVEEDAKWDGYFGYVTNNSNLSVEEVVKSYKMLWQIEESFRCLKSTLDIRPVFHWTAKRIEGHIMLCFLSFYVLRVIMKKLSEAGIHTTVELLREELEKIKAIEIKTEKAKVYARTSIEGENYKILQALGTKIPSFILKEQSVVG